MASLSAITAAVASGVVMVAWLLVMRSGERGQAIRDGLAAELVAAVAVVSADPASQTTGISSQDRRRNDVAVARRAGRVGCARSRGSRSNKRVRPIRRSVRPRTAPTHA